MLKSFCDACQEEVKRTEVYTLRVDYYNGDKLCAHTLDLCRACSDNFTKSLRRFLNEGKKEKEST